MTIAERIKAAMSGGSETNDEKLTAASVTIAALTEENEQLKGENARYREADQKRSSEALASARDTAKKAATAAKGQQSADLPAIYAQIDGMTDVGMLNTLANAYALAGQTAANPNRQTNVDDPATKPDEDAAAAALSAEEETLMQTETGRAALARRKAGTGKK
jgi:hypothetical protein